MADAPDRGRSAVAGQAWAEAQQWLSAADQAAPLEPDDLERLATAAFLVGREEESAEAWARAHQELLARGETERAAMSRLGVGRALIRLGQTGPGVALLDEVMAGRDHRGREGPPAGQPVGPGAPAAAPGPASTGSSEPPPHRLPGAAPMGGSTHLPAGRLWVVPSMTGLPPRPTVGRARARATAERGARRWEPSRTRSRTTTGQPTTPAGGCWPASG